MLIEMLDDNKTVEHQVIDYWLQSQLETLRWPFDDLTTDSSWKASTIPGASWNETVWNPKPNPDILNSGVLPITGL